MKFEGRLLKKNTQFFEKSSQKSTKFAIRKKHAQKTFQNPIWERLGVHLGRFQGRFGSGLEPLGSFWVVLEALFFKLVFGVVSTVLMEAPGLDDGKRRLRSLKLVSAPQGPNRGESLRGGISRETFSVLEGLGG